MVFPVARLFFFFFFKETRSGLFLILGMMAGKVGFLMGSPHVLGGSCQLFY